MNSTMDSIYKGYWKCRDLEIQMLWTRLALLGTFMALTYTGYGVLVIKTLGEIKHWGAFNLLGVAAGCFGILFSVLWITTAKGSKGWFERYEAMIKRFQEEHGKDLTGPNGDVSILSYLGYSGSKLEPYLGPIDSSLFTQCAGRYSVSKIPIMMGQVSLFGWGFVIVGHTWCLVVGKGPVRLVVEHFGLKIIPVAILGLLLAVSVICRNVKSGGL